MFNEYDLKRSELVFNHIHILEIELEVFFNSVPLHFYLHFECHKILSKEVLSHYSKYHIGNVIWGIICNRS
jgi:hypothetical protein